MDEEKEQKNGQAQTPASALNKGAKKLGEQAKKKVVKTIIATLVPILLKGIVIILAIYLAISAISHFLDAYDSEESKQASGSAIVYGDKAKANKITVDIKNITNNGGYKLSYKFKGEKGKILTDNEAIKQIKEDLFEENEKIDLSKFSDSELKIIGALMYNGLETGKYNEEQLKALAIFVKTDIAGRRFDLRSGDNKEVTVDEMSKSDVVYGTLELHKTTPITDEEGNLVYEEVKLEYLAYEVFSELIEKKDKSVLSKFSLDENGNLLIARMWSKTTKYTYQYIDGTEVSESDMDKISEEYISEGKSEFDVLEYQLPINYEKYIIKYIATYGFLSDLLIATTNVDFCLDISELALNSKIVLNLREEVTSTDRYDETMYTQTTLLYDYITYEVNGYNVTEHWETIETGNGSPSNSSTPSSYGWSSGMGYTETGENGRTLIYRWKKAGQDYKLNYINLSSYKKWTLYKRREEETQSKKESGSGTLIVGGHITETDGEYAIDEDYTAKEEFTFKKIEESYTWGSKFDIDISEIDGWYLKYKRPYEKPIVETTIINPPSDENGQYPQESEVILEPTKDSGIINSDEHVISFIKDKEDEYLKKNLNIDKVECNVTELSVKKKTKTNSKLINFSGTKNEYKFGNEEQLDTTQAHFKNLKYLNGAPTFTEEGEDGKPEIGFLYIYDQYMKAEIDLCLQNDAEKKFFEVLESNKETQDVSDIMKFLLYVYDGIDRGVTDLDKSFKVIDIVFFNRKGISPFGCNLTKEEFLEGTRKIRPDSVLAGLGELFYDVCMEYDVNPCLAYIWAAYESGWGSSAVDDKNLFQMGTYTDQTSGFTYASYEDSIRAFCEWVLDASNPSSSLYSFCYTRAQEFATVNEKFKGTPDSNIYALFSPFGWVGYVHNGNARACIKMTYEYFSEKEYECTHGDTEDTTMQERADYMDFIISSRIEFTKEVFGKNCFIGTVIFPEYNQYSGRWINCNYGGPNGRPSVPANKGKQKTIGTSGCGCCALAMIISGYTGEEITPDILTRALDEKYPAGNYYSPGNGSSAGALCAIVTEYGCSFSQLKGRGDALEALKEGYAVLGGETGHYLAFVPVDKEEAAQGYVFRILDSARDHGGLYRSFEEADAVVDGNCVVTHVIYPPE